MRLVPSSSSRLTVSNWRHEVVERKSAQPKLWSTNSVTPSSAARFLVAHDVVVDLRVQRIQVRGRIRGIRRDEVGRRERHQADRRARELVDGIVVPGERGGRRVRDVPAQRCPRCPVLLRPQVAAGCRILDPAVAPVPDAVDAQRDVLGERHVDHALDVLLVELAEAQLDQRVELVDGLARHDRDRTRGAVATEQRALRALSGLSMRSMSLNASSDAPERAA